MASLRTGAAWALLWAAASGCSTLGLPDPARRSVERAEAAVRRGAPGAGMDARWIRPGRAPRALRFELGEFSVREVDGGVAVTLVLTGFAIEDARGGEGSLALGRHRVEARGLFPRPRAGADPVPALPGTVEVTYRGPAGALRIADPQWTLALAPPLGLGSLRLPLEDGAGGGPGGVLDGAWAARVPSPR